MAAGCCRRAQRCRPSTRTAPATTASGPPRRRWRTRARGTGCRSPRRRCSSPFAPRSSTRPSSVSPPPSGSRRRWSSPARRSPTSSGTSWSGPSRRGTCGSTEAPAMSTDTDRQPAYATYPSLRGRTAFVSGGASGPGADFVGHLAGQGARVGFVDVDVERGRALEQQLRTAGAEVLFLEADVRDVPALQTALAEVAGHFDPITVLVNNAANDHRDKVMEMDLSLWDERQAVNLRHHFFAAQAVAPGMRDAGGGSIINLGSISAHIDLMDLPGYITAKAGIEGLTRTLAREFGPWRVRVNCIIPGWIMTEKQLTEWVTPEAEASIARNQCLPQKLTPDDVARMLLWLAADDSRSCTAQQWIVDGGWM